MQRRDSGSIRARGPSPAPGNRHARIKLADAAQFIRATEADTEEAVRDMQEDEAMTREALDLLSSRRNDTY